MEKSIQKQDPIKKTVFQAQKQFLAVDDQMNFNKEASFCIQLIENSEGLKKCLMNDPISIRNAIVNVATTGLSLNPVLNYAYLIPRKGKCVLDIGYQGLIKIMTDTGNIRNIDANDVFMNDEFFIQKGSKPEIIHRPTIKDRGDYIGTYAIAFFSTGGEQFLFMNKEEIEAVRNVSDAKESKYSPWNTDFVGEMRKKTVMRRLYKILPKSKINERTLEALQLENENNPVTFKKKEETVTEDLFPEAEIIDEVNEAVNEIKKCDTKESSEAVINSYPHLDDEPKFKKAAVEQMKLFNK